MSARIREKVKGSGKWYVTVIHQGHRRSALAGDKRTAEATAREINRKILAGTFHLDTEEAVKTVAEYAAIFIAETTIKPATRDNYKSLLDKHILPVMGGKKIDTVTRLDVKSFLRQKLKDGYTISTVRNLKAALANIFDLAYDDEAIEQNPAARLGRLTGRAQDAHKSETTAHFLTRDELARLLAAFAKHDPEHYALALLLARTGMRPGEAVAMQWRDIDFDRRIITVRRSKSRRIIDTPKSGKGREVDMSAQLAEVLQSRKKEMLQASTKNKAVPTWVFPGKGSETLDNTSWRRNHFDAMVEVAGIGKTTVRDLRHTYASLMIEQGQTLIYIQRQLGHHSILMTADTYSHLLPTADRGAVDALDDQTPKKRENTIGA